MRNTQMSNRVEQNILVFEMGSTLQTVIEYKVKIQSELISNNKITQLEIRCDITASSRYLALEDNFVRVAQEKGNGSKAYYFKMPGMDKVLLDNYMAARNNGMMWQKSTMDANGKCLIQDRQKRDLVAGDGIVPQITKYASKYNYSRFSLNVLTEAMQAMSLKAENPVGNVWAFTVNMPLYHQFQREAPAFLRDNKVDQQYLYSKIEGKNIKIGATYSAYEFGGKIMYCFL